MNALGYLKLAAGDSRHLEEREQAAVIEWAGYALPGLGVPRDCLFAIPNGAHLAGDREQRAKQMGRLKRVGLLPGAADLLLAAARGRRHGLWLEMKKPRECFRSPREAERAVSADQRLFGERQLEQGYAWAVCYGADEAMETIMRYLRGEW